MSRNYRSVLLTAAAIFIGSAVAISLLAQAPAPGVPGAKGAPGGAKGKGGRGGGPTGPAPRTADGKVDFSGVWNGGGSTGNIAQGLPMGETLPLSPAGQKVLDSRQSKDDPEANCLPTGIPRQAPYPWRWVQTPTHMFMLFEGNIHSFRQILMDAKHPADPDPTWYGHSIGSWDGDTLVVDTVGFNDKFWFDFRGNPHTEQLHTVERYTRPDLGTMVNAVTITDPGAYTRPFTVTFRARLTPNTELMEYICQENQQDAQHLQGAPR